MIISSYSTVSNGSDHRCWPGIPVQPDGLWTILNDLWSSSY